MLFFKLTPSIEHQKNLKIEFAKAVIDVGANNGQFASLIIKTHPTKNNMFEPQIEPFNNLKNIQKQKFKLFRLACGSKQLK